MLDREREVLLLLAHESRGDSDRNLFVQLITYGQDPHCQQLVMTAVLGGELFDLLTETGAMVDTEVHGSGGSGSGSSGGSSGGGSDSRS